MWQGGALDVYIGRDCLKQYLLLNVRLSTNRGQAMLDKLFFDKQDYALITLVSKILTQKESSTTERIFDANLHPHGIKTLMLSHEMRVAHAVARLLTSLGHADVDDTSAAQRLGSYRRLSALRTLYDEVFNSAKTLFRRNTARVLIQIMKDIVRSHGNVPQQLALAHDFRRAANGSPRVVREQLKRYGLVEMPEDWSQLAFDHHVHDANTKGRKNPTQLIMDAWIKGIRHMTIIYYNYIEPHIAHEVLQAAEIMGVDVLIGLEFTVPYGGKYIQVVWTARDFPDTESFLHFLDEAPTRHLMNLGREVSAFRARAVYRALEHWNECHRPALLQCLPAKTSLPPLAKEDFVHYVGTGQATPPHLSTCVFEHIQKHVPLAVLPAEWATLTAVAEQLHAKSADSFWARWAQERCLGSAPEQAGKQEQGQEQTPCPQLMTLSPVALLDWLSSLHSASFLILHLTNLTAEDVLELLWHCKGLITHLEIFNFQAWEEGRLSHLSEITELLHLLNGTSLPRLKYFVLNMLDAVEAEEGAPRKAERCALLREILQNIRTMKNFYAKQPLRTRMGTDAASSVDAQRDMGLVIPDTLPAQAQSTLDAWHTDGDAVHVADHIPLHIEVHYQVRYSPQRLVPQKSLLTRFLRLLPWSKYYGYRKEQTWHTHSSICTFHADDTHKKQSNVSLLSPAACIAEAARCKAARAQESTKRFAYLNTRVANVLKVLAGFIPASIAFQYTQSWWFLAWFGPVIWFAITGGRNILQAVMAGGGRSTLLRWKDYVSWSRLCDSLMYTGFSVPLLEWGVRIWLLEKNLGYTVAEQTILVYTTMSIVNGLYISWHNFIRGLPKEAIIGNLFRSALAIPLSMLYNALILEALQLFNVVNPQVIMQTSAAIISKMASDTVAGVIEGHADRSANRRVRYWDYEGKLQQILQTYSQLELLFPEENIVALLSKPRQLLKRLGDQHKELKIAIIINALDLMYLWLYRPRGQDVFRRLLQRMSKEERVIIGRFQLVLLQEREVSQLFVDGMTGRNFAGALSLYLDKYQRYLKGVLPLCAVSATPASASAPAPVPATATAPVPVPDTNTTKTLDKADT